MSDNQDKKGLTPENTKKLFKWEGKKEFIWIGGIILVALASYGYWVDMQVCQEIINDPCTICEQYQKINASLSEKDNINVSINISYGNETPEHSV